ncbi:alpha/beta fold hydrolase [Solirubrobacter phytolaccae]|uniref:Alpha/beta fold hydrolase n=1 Tax=Solirubrobacter phytolaccae TaxID=1404360 RepID=A0A9X3NEF8_9ACTN|nr:alpha/beta fold hydrolase [Solirubrobacter phytolaccae]MDA0184963.1 alpha/beta fold hydrolase [Solirubrobacter phytolaccae]
MEYMRTGSGQPLLLVHGLGGSRHSFDPITSALAAEREVIAPDLPGFGKTPPLSGNVSIATLADALEGFIDEHDLDGVDCAGTSMGARLALELARRGRVGATVALDPGGFWNARERRVFGASVRASIAVVRALQPVMPALARSSVGRSVLLAQFSARPRRLPGHVVLREMQSYAEARAIDDTLDALVHGPPQAGMPAGTARGPIAIGWGRRDLVCLPRQAKRAIRQFPDARLHWFDRCGHFPQWDRPHEATRLILETTAADRRR